MATGRKPKPTALKLIQGNPGRRPLNKKEPKSSATLPCPPSWLTTRAKSVFRLLVKRLDGMGYASASHTEALALAAWRLEQVQACAKALNENGLTYETINQRGATVVKPRPEVAMQGEAARHAQSLLAEFGLTPSSATRVQVPGKPKSNSFNQI
ncbi:MAG: phage terminase small subunit P27 family [Deltaproteobacteria bacterium]|nr:phage terminase small subunit P27 family [Deltaproteobacteria bacterium]